MYMIGNCKIMGIVNLTPDSFLERSRVQVKDLPERIRQMHSEGADIIDLGAVSTRPGAGTVDTDEEWRRLERALRLLQKEDLGVSYSIDTTSSEIVRRAYDVIGPLIVNDISASEKDPAMLPTAGELGLEYIAMHSRGTPATMDGLCDYPGGVVPALLDYFRDFSQKADKAGIKNWILDPGLGFAKTPRQCMEILEKLPQLKTVGVKVMIGAADKRFTLELAPTREEGTRIANRMALEGGADVLRVHDTRQII